MLRKAATVKLADYQLRKVSHLFGVGKTTRPKWTKLIDSFTESALEPIRRAIRDADWEGFAATTQFAVDEANRIHVDIGYGYIVYKIQPDAPSHMSLDPPAKE